MKTLWFEFGGSPPSLIPAHWNIGILHYKQAKRRKDMQHSVRIDSTYVRIRNVYVDIHNSNNSW